ncbi:putative deacylase [Xenococcus sp. PCC 7305]|uniref:succinylglutamate desuccinylase/aspartoacylase family protein n=1 Tax=Xenococcus sp. PCC 7305 TaxID=102125 RepID=UPI0002AD0AF8|nr:succinylglutamate desuccinylase/aspartoacylase family protein [Xenococcus sp. PCC 7305]ELS00861.1 putative deacylase [Xenococcus sp. PCC 7305]
MNDNPQENTIEIAKEIIPPGRSRRLDLPVSRLPTQTLLSLPVTIVNGLDPGPKLWLSAAIHGDELNGVEIIRQVLAQIRPEKLRGTLLAVPIVNVFGFIEQSRYLPDRRDLNRSFPGSEKGSLASRLAFLFMREIVSQSTHGIDLHTAAINRVNLPQIRGNLQDPETHRCAKAFGTKIMLHANTRDGSLRQAATKKGIPVLLYEAGEALRFNAEAIAIGVQGILRVMNCLDMYDLAETVSETETIEVTSSKWIRASRGGIFHLGVNLGEKVVKKQELGFITDAVGESQIKVRASVSGIVLSYSLNPLVNQGDAIVHLAIIN